MRRRLKRIGVGLVAVGLSLTLLLAGAIPVCEAEREEERVTVGAFTALTGALATSGVPLSYGYLDYLRRTNDHGGINGTKVRVMWEDTRCEIPRGITFYKRAKWAGAVLLLNFCTNISELLVSHLPKDELPLLQGGSISLLMITYPERWIFGGGCGLGPEAGLVMKWIKENWAEERPPRAGIMFYDIASGWEFYRGHKYAPEVGVEFVGHEVLPLRGSIDLSTELLRLAAKRPDWVLTAATGVTLVTLIKDAKRLGMAEKGIEFCQGIGMLGENIVAVVGQDAEGWYSVSTVPYATESGLPGMKAVFEAANRYRGWKPQDVPNDYIKTWVEGQVGVEGIRLAIEKVGIENLTGTAVRDALASIRDFDTGLIKPITMSDEWPYFATYEKIYQVQQGEFIPVSDWIKPDWDVLSELEGEKKTLC